jgi:hypothetical protein
MHGFGIWDNSQLQLDEHALVIGEEEVRLDGLRDFEWRLSEKRRSGRARSIAYVQHTIKATGHVCRLVQRVRSRRIRWFAGIRPCSPKSEYLKDVSLAIRAEVHVPAEDCSARWQFSFDVLQLRAAGAHSIIGAGRLQMRRRHLDIADTLYVRFREAGDPRKRASALVSSGWQVGEGTLRDR